MPRIRTVILNGFLGSGKTTLLRSLLVQASRADLSIGVVVNDMSEQEVDGLIVTRTEFFDRDDHHYQSIYSCVLSSQRGLEELRKALDDLLSVRPPDLLIIETSGSCHPMPLIEYFREESRFLLTGVLTLVDSAMLEQDYECGLKIFPTMQRNLRSQQRDTTNLLVEQVMFCSHLMLTKVDRIDPEKLQTIARSVHELNPLVSVVSLPWGNLPIDELLDMPEYDYDRVAGLIQELKPTFESESQGDRPYDLATRAIRDDRPFHPRRLWEICQHHLGQHIYRSKGFFYLPSRDSVSLLWNQAAGGINLELVGYWRAGILEDPDQNLDEEEREGLREMMAREAGRFGDRHCHLTVIGNRDQVDHFTELLRSCFLTEEEVEHWQSGGEFEDPWPANFVTRKH